MYITPAGEVFQDPEAIVAIADPASRGMNGKYTYFDRTRLYNINSNMITATGVVAFIACWIDTESSSNPKFIHARSMHVSKAMKRNFVIFLLGTRFNLDPKAKNGIRATIVTAQLVMQVRIG
mmetsp:Transcript_22718/g.33875  ORF Transcript_22718/g.33875 Transcript_22718/m.33875 type:complete len:122 (+) Transcript_22718:184-549(+)